MIVVDTSVWINAFRSKSSAEAVRLGALLDADEVCLTMPVRLEILSGASRDNEQDLRRLLSATPISYPTDDTWQLIDQWMKKATKVGQRFGVADLMIAAAAAELGALVWSLDEAFDRMAALGFVQTYQPEGL